MDDVTRDAPRRAMDALFLTYFRVNERVLVNVSENLDREVLEAESRPQSFYYGLLFSLAAQHWSLVLVIVRDFGKEFRRVGFVLELPKTGHIAVMQNLAR